MVAQRAVGDLQHSPQSPAKYQQYHREPGALAGHAGPDTGQILGPILTPPQRPRQQHPEQKTRGAEGRADADRSQCLPQPDVGPVANLFRPCGRQPAYADLIHGQHGEYE